MGAIAIHHTDTSDGPWDGPKNKANLKNGQDFDYYKKAFAWRDPQGDESNKSTYKFIHHEVSAGGDIGAANIKGCQSGIGVLNGAMGGANIPDGDRQGVWDHLAAHLKDAEVEPAELKRSLENFEFDLLGRGMNCRTFDMDALEVRAGITDKEKHLTGHGAVYDKWSVDLGGFRELFEQGTFAESIKRDDICSLQNHEPHYILGRTKANTLTLAEDKKGVKFDVTLPDTSYAHDLLISVERGDINGCSIIFFVDPKDERWFVDGEEVEWLDAMMAMWDENKHKIERRISKAGMADIGPVTFPAYPQTDVKARAVEMITGIDYSALGTAIFKSHRGMSLDAKETKLLAKAGEMIARNTKIIEITPDHQGAPPAEGRVEGLDIHKRAIEASEKYFKQE